MRVGTERFEVVGVFDKRPAAGGFNLNQDDFVVIPYTVYQRIYRSHARSASAACGTIVQHPDLARAARRRQPGGRASTMCERVMRSRHGLKLDEPDDFDLGTQDQFLKLWDRSARARSSR